MLGVDSIDDSSPNLDLSLFTTDYYTYKCLCYIYKELRSINSQPLIVQTIDDVNRISPFMCSFAIGGFLSLNLHNEEVYFLGRRSSTVACPNTWHISFDETFDLRDRIQKQGYPFDINICLERGIREELGFQVFDYNFVYDITALSVIQNDTRCELELFVLSHCKLKNIKEFNNIIFQMYSAPDFENENDNIQLIKANDIISFYGNKIKLGEHTTDEAIPLWQFFSQIRAHRNKLDKFLNKIQD